MKRSGLPDRPPAGGSLLQLQNITAFLNTTSVAGGALETSGGVTVLVTDSILWSNSAAIGDQINVDPTCTVIVSYTDIEGELKGIEGKATWGSSNIDADPLFANPNSGDFHLTADSPCIDAGDPDFVPDPNETDIHGEPRLARAVVDMGADEFHDCDGKRRTGHP